MSRKHPIIAVTGSSGAGTSTTKIAFEHIFHREGVRALVIQGDSFHRYEREEMRRQLDQARAEQRVLSHYGPEANLLERLEALFQEYGEHGTGQYRHYLHDEAEAAVYGQSSGTFTPWEAVPEGTDLLLYEGLHGGVVTDTLNVARHVDLLVGMVPIINLEWIQKIHRDTTIRGYSRETVMAAIESRMHDYIRYIMPQFSRTHINFQRVPTVDTSNPFIARDIPTQDESFVVIRFRYPKRVNFPYLVTMLHGAFVSRRNTLVVPGGKMGLAMELILNPLIEELLENR